MVVAGLLVGGAAAGQLPPQRPDTIRLVLVRFDPGSGPIEVSGGIPFPPGRLSADMLPSVRLEVGGQEPSSRIEALEGRYSDGSIRSILVQFRYDVPPATSLQPDVFLIIDPDRLRKATVYPVDAPAYTYDDPLPTAAALPSEVDYLLATRLVGPTVRVGDPFARQYDADFTRWGDPKWAEYSGKLSSGLSATDAAVDNYYDRALANYAWWVRTGNPEYWKRATLYVIGYRERYLRPNEYRAQPHNIQIEGLVLHYLLTGDAESRRGVGAHHRILRILPAEHWQPGVPVPRGAHSGSRASGVPRRQQSGFH